MSILVFGRSGQLARELQRLAPQATYLGRGEADLAQSGRAREAIESLAPKAIVNASAWTAVDAAETEAEAAFQVNQHAVAEMAEVAAARGIPLIHVSTDYVFDGLGDTPRKTDDQVAPLGVYGASKLAGEDAIRRSGAPHVILRTAWVFSAHGNNFVKTMLRLAESRDRLTIVADQFGGPTPARDLARACMTCLNRLADDPGVTGTYHFSGGPDTNWSGFAREIFKQSGHAVEVVDIPSSEFPTPAKRPANSRLDCETTREVFGLSRPDWTVGLGEVLSELAQEATS